ncbi:DODA-type extradiol aromatic ring-opening family dioxygenase [Novosphingobium mangrovi (ex Huang et al. 2023)]|uniref:Dioxygenase n=1 Tax=Novosphingobium mangrovi (ex Huang et al. 2023) TaxID=2976432 RepID=A0ABT2I9Y8_9SPHN|nr:class III extradiol ring-cleavage dioxygenase [Novosphingobium mangrovi (ex Huang et al. 2023)]MCT2401645.1 dioxygenase [Novosphingobium mangrovi (ex Huang et al. 2023)]
MTRQPSLFIPHGGGPCFFMDDPNGAWTSMEHFLRSLPTLLPEVPKAILVVSAHWETKGFAFTGAPQPALIYDYYGFPPHTYELRFDAPGAPELAAKAAALLEAAGLESALDPRRGYDHGVFIPLKVAWPDADVPVVEMSVDGALDPALHLAAGKALAPLRDEGVLIVGSGMSFHNMRGYGDPRFTEPSRQFDDWLTQSVKLPASERAAALAHWSESPGGRLSHPREEHLIPLMVVAGTAEGPGEQVFGDLVLKTAISGYRFD